MPQKLDKRHRAEVFRARLGRAMTEAGLSGAALGRAVGVDRSTVSQLLAEGAARLPNAQVVGECATALGVSADWLLGLTERPETAAALVAASMTMTEAPRALIDEQVFAWHQEARGYKIRNVPAGLPDMLKTPAMLRWEYEAALGRTADQAIGASQDRLALLRHARSDYEFALPLHELGAFARGEGYYAGCPPDVRSAQVAHMAGLHAQLYPTLRVHLFDARRVYSAPVTVFGPLLAVLYLGQSFLAFRDTERVEAMTRHFDRLVREAEIPSRGFAEHLAGLAPA